MPAWAINTCSNGYEERNTLCGNYKKIRIMRTKPILFSTPMVHAILNGQKTQTRRVVKWNKKIENPKLGFTAFCDEREFAVRGVHENGQYGESLFNAPICKGDVLWVRETWEKMINGHNEEYFVYKADDYFEKPCEKWKPSIFMPKEACRLFLEVTKVRLERLHDIKEFDAIAEGIDSFYNELFKETRYRDYYHGKRRDRDFDAYPNTAKSIGYSHYGGNPWPDWRDPIASFSSLWESINAKKQSWDSNPWVWVYEFKQVEKPFDFITDASKVETA